MTDCPHVGVGRVTRPISIFCCLIYGADEAGHFIFGLQIKRRLLPLCMLKFLNIVHLGSLDLLKFGEISVNISEMVQDRDIQGGPKKLYIFQHTISLEPFKIKWC